MSFGEIKKTDFDNIFANELDYLNRAENVAKKGADITRGELLKEYNILKENYESLMRQTKKIIRIGDSNQRKLREAQLALQEKNARINEQNNSLKSLNATKDKFFSIISHDLRNPVTSILMMAEILKYSSDKLTKEEAEKKIDSIITGIKNLFDLFDNLLKWSNAQTGRIKFSPEKVDIEESIESAFSLLATNADHKDIKLISDLPDGFTAIADKNMFETILRNLVANSIKFTHKGGYVKVSGEANHEGVIINVEDNGIGLGPGELNRIFKIGEQIKSRGTNDEGGSGLGLLICKEFTDMHGGSIWAESVKGKGATFKFLIPDSK